ncbi:MULTISPECIES: Gfo/Idh/MocA family oxidoreductase [unclassified Arthrobacter]|uniref:Gfo/Idh/MocA family protein n=1 Tax=unclassified Arthrobacter TaxID=235627 RepID=UPI001CFFF487|nr:MULTISPECIES: Gfo/Idh/MocA family oxidoreductase [unclassified Arthrobacter]MCB5281383.1 1,5-anhydro-D-fructose reductase [Arthrobacter sp. ES1]WGZ80167.1 Gfo/Idh/MocA family oxidoreductase [Arthrobacter sp. EM1]
MTAHIATPWLFSQPDSDPRTATGARLRWGVIATGGIAAAVTRDLELLADAELYAVSSRSQPGADAFAADFGFARAYGDGDGRSGYERLLADDAVDVVYVATPHAHHHRIALAALNAGKHVLCEKALTVNAREAAELVSVARVKGLFLMEAMWSRFLPGMQRAFEIAASGELGDVKWVAADLGFPAPYSPTSRLWAPNDGGGALLDLTVYPLLWALGTLGFPATVSATGWLNEDGVDAQNALTLGYRHGAQAQLTSSLLAYGPRTATVAGSKGFLQSIGSINNPKELLVRVGFDDPRIESFDVVGRGYSYELREVTRCIQQGLAESPVMPLEDSLNTMRLFDGVRSQLGVSYPNDAR